jgi:hypothetical protein
MMREDLQSRVRPTSEAESNAQAKRMVSQGKGKRKKAKGGGLLFPHLVLPSLDLIYTAEAVA